MSKRLSLSIGGIVLALFSDRPGCELVVEQGYERFVTDDRADAIFQVHYGRVPKLELEQKVFDSGSAWSLYRGRGKWVVWLHSPAFGSRPYQLAVLEPDFRSGDIYIEADGRDSNRCPFPLGYPLAEVLMVNLLSRGYGVLLHAFGIIYGGRGILFAGTSGAGKSTLATLWEGQEDGTLLSDDRVIVRQRDGRFWAYGTPWHGDARAASPEAVPLGQIFVIQHADENRAVSLIPVDAVSRLLVRSFPTFWDSEGMAFTLRFLDQLSQAVPCYDLGFVPDGSIVDYVRWWTSA